jgi:Na+:H+ antiporter, NhaA family
MASTTETASSRRALMSFIHHETTGGVMLVAAAILAILAFNIEAIRPLYEAALSAKLTISLGSFGISKPLLLWINDGLMAIFFFLVGLEIKREVVEGNLSSTDQIVLPALAALGGMVGPALIYSYFNSSDPLLAKGWAIPAATDIAFSLAALSLIGARVPPSLKVFLLTLATLDDLGAIIIIALFYTKELSTFALAGSAIMLGFLFLLNRLHVGRTAVYVLAGIVLWTLVLKSGVHATLAGVALGLMIPVRRKDGSSFVHALEEALHPYVKFAILPIFAFANAGLPLDGFVASKLSESLPFGIAAGLALGKPLGITLLVLLAVITGFARLPDRCNWLHIIGVGFLAGIGFTMSLFIGSLAFDDAPEKLAYVRVGVVAGSVVAMLIGVLVLLAANGKRQPAS